MLEKLNEPTFKKFMEDIRMTSLKTDNSNTEMI